jgi:hypothetical protein
MTDLHEVQRHLQWRISTRTVGTASFFALMNAEKEVSLAIEAEAREAAAQSKEQTA